jgi:hypothetical protein
MSGGPPAGRPASPDEEAHLAALLAVLALAAADDDPDRTPLQQWRARRLAALSHRREGTGPAEPGQ